MITPTTEASLFLALPPAKRVSALERVHHCINLLYSLPATTSRNECIDVLDQHLHAIFEAHYTRPIPEFHSRFAPPTRRVPSAVGTRKAPAARSAIPMMGRDF
jgi:hypothetical protein